jgi:alkylation response protein AidB-like acyl-CoA dehydrogenase
MWGRIRSGSKLPRFPSPPQKPVMQIAPDRSETRGNSDGSTPTARLSTAEFLERYRETLRRVFRRRADADEMATSRGLPPFVIRDVLNAGPLSSFVPKEHGGRGSDLGECQAVLEASSYESMALGLMMGINGGLFVQPVAKYGDPALRSRVLPRFADGRAMGGLMITEPDFGSDALSMRSRWSDDGDRFHLVGTKHWAGLTGWADYWLVTARQQGEGGSLSRDVDLFVCAQDDAEQHIEVEERFNNLGLWAIPYGRNKLDLRVPKTNRLQSRGTGISMLLDLLHRSRMQFPGMGLGFIRRMLDEGLDHCRERVVGGRPLIDYDQVRARLAQMQAQYTAVSAMCLWTSENAGVDRDLSKEAIPANAIKSVCTDFMQHAAQSLLQLVGAKGYRLDHVAGRGVVDSRPFQIFEGSNDILYEQLSQAYLKGMRRVKENNLYRFLKSEDLTSRAADYFRDLLDFEVDPQMPQRKLVELGEALGRIISIDLTIDLGERGFRGELVSNALISLRSEVEARLATFRGTRLAEMVDSYTEDGRWLSFVSPTPAGLVRP